MQERAYSYKPRPKFFGRDTVYFGLELEVEAPDHAAKQRGLTEAGEPTWCYAKRDGSLGMYGTEIVTHPISMNFWLSRGDVGAYHDYHDVPVGTVLTARYKGVTYTAEQLTNKCVRWNGTVYSSISAAGKAIRGGKATNGYDFFGLTRDVNPNPCGAFFALVANLKRLGYDSHDGGRCGFHVHISRTAFGEDGDIRNPKFFRFKSLVNGALFRKLSQRTEFRFCQQEPVSAENFTWCPSRYSAVNITSKTIEVRIFRGNLRESRLRKNLEAIIAALEFARMHDGSYTSPTDAEFVAYVRSQPEKFPNLIAYIRELESATTTTETESCA